MPLMCLVLKPRPFSIHQEFVVHILDALRLHLKKWLYNSTTGYGHQNQFSQDVKLFYLKHEDVLHER